MVYVSSVPSDRGARPTRRRAIKLFIAKHNGPGGGIRFLSCGKVNIVLSSTIVHDGTRYHALTAINYTPKR